MTPTVSVDLNRLVSHPKLFKGMKQQMVTQEKEIVRLRTIVERLGKLQPLGESIFLDSRPNPAER